MVAHLELRTNDLLHNEIDNSSAGILSAWEKTECYVALHSQRIFTLIQNNNFLFLIKVKIRLWAYYAMSVLFNERNT